MIFFAMFLSFLLLFLVKREIVGVYYTLFSAAIQAVSRV
jgi:hypothetical protein